ncbi:MAG: cysteine hydrolase [Actinobacteria bacterium]|nr:cysteine hydrolase [Actinomycetota bacterium]
MGEGSEAERRPALIVIDVQRAFDNPAWGARNNPAAERRIAALLSAWRAAGAPVLHVRHESVSPNGIFRRGTPAFDFKPEAQPADGEPVIDKRVNSAFIGTDLEKRLRAEGISALVIAGLTTDHCCSTTARMAGNLGFETWFVSDATATFDRTGPDGERIPAETMHRTALASLDGEFAEVVTSEEAILRIRAKGAKPS